MKWKLTPLRQHLHICLCTTRLRPHIALIATRTGTRAWRFPRGIIVLSIIEIAITILLYRLLPLVLLHIVTILSCYWVTWREIRKLVLDNDSIITLEQVFCQWDLIGNHGYSKVMFAGTLP
jgi:hypothetical protein